MIEVLGGLIVELCLILKLGGGGCCNSDFIVGVLVSLLCLSGIYIVLKFFINN